MFKNTTTLRQRFEDKIDKTPGHGPDGKCWLWVGAKRGNGYGAIKVDGRAHDAHRVSYYLKNGDIPEGMFVMHSCDTRCCVNPDHLSLGTMRDNHMDAIKKGRVKPFKPQRRDPLTDEEIETLVDEYNRGVSKRALCKKYELAPTSLTRVINNQMKSAS